MRGAGAFERIKTLGADYMFNAAGVLHSGFWVYPQAGKPAGKEGVALIHTLGNLLPRGQQRDVPIVVHLNIAVLPQVLHGNAHAGLGKIQLVGNIDGTHVRAPLAEH